MKVIMQQLELDYFWPLTEQISLDLDYTDCNKPKFDSTIPVYTISAMNNGHIMAAPVSINFDNTPITVSGKIPWYRKLLFKLLGFKIR